MTDRPQDAAAAQAEREAFETWTRDKRLDLERWEDEPDSEYTTDDTCIAWKAWRAALASAAPQPAPGAQPRGTDAQDAKRLDWLEQRIVHVREHARWGMTREVLSAHSVCDEEDGITASTLRAAIDSAMEPGRPQRIRATAPGVPEGWRIEPTQLDQELSIVPPMKEVDGQRIQPRGICVAEWSTSDNSRILYALAAAISKGGAK